MSKPTPERLLYKPLDFAMVRAPLLPVEAYLSLRSTDDQFALLEDPRVRRAVAVGSVSLLNALDRLALSTLTKREAERLRAKLLRYQIRMSTRPTPYGLFAGSAIVSVGARTDVTIGSTFGRSHTRPDMAWLMDLVLTAESDLAIRRKLELVRNPLTRADGDRISLAERMPAGSGPKRQPVSARATSVVKLALDLAKTPIEYGQLAARLVEASPSATPEKVDRLLTELWEQTFLLTELRPPLTTDSPAHHVAARLDGIAEAAPILERLAAFLEAAARWDRSPHDESVSGFRALLERADCPEDGSKDASIQVDMALSVQGQLGSAIAEEAARAAELLLRLSPSPRGLSSMTAYRNAFLTRYGQEREVPLLELLDPDRGLGSVSNHGHAPVGPDPVVAAKRSDALLALACSALHKRQRAIHLDDGVIRRLETWQPDADTAPISLDVNVLVAARSADAIDAGDFTLVVGPNLGAWAAGRNFGRFAHLHDPERGGDLLRVAAETEQAGHFRDHLWAEVVYLPSTVRSANVAVRPPVRAHEIVVGVAPGVPQSGVIPLDELMVGVANGRFYVRWSTAGKPVRFVSGHMLNHHGAPPVARFLLEVSHDGLVPFMSFDWGPAEGFPFLPRVQVGRVVLRPAEWKIAKDVIAPADVASFEKWRQEWEAPKYICLAYGDNRLILDLDLHDHVQQILDELAKLAEGRSLLLQEVLPALDEAWLTGDEGHYYSEFIVPLVLRPAGLERRAERTPTSGEAIAEARGEGIPERERTPSRSAVATRQFPPGTEWLLVKLYCASHREDDLIADSLSSFANNAIASGLADSWFFIRYADPERHIRLRFHGSPDRLSTQLFGQVCQWANGLIAMSMCTRFVFDTYDREIERFGGPEGMAVSESLFHADSRAAAALVRVLKTREWTDDDRRTTLFALTVDDLLHGVGLDDARCLEWYKRQAGAAVRDAGTDYRRLKSLLRAAVGDPAGWLAQQPFGDAIGAALTQRRQELAGLATRFHELADAGLLDRSLETLCSSFAHLHLNRIGGAVAERMLLGLLFRTRDSLRKAPFQAGRSRDM